VANFHFLLSSDASATLTRRLLLVASFMQIERPMATIAANTGSLSGD
jgi:hypothetical protein